MTAYSIGVRSCHACAGRAEAQDQAAVKVSETKAISLLHQPRLATILLSSLNVRLRQPPAMLRTDLDLHVIRHLVEQINEVLKVDSNGEWTTLIDDPARQKLDHPADCTFGGLGLQGLYLANLEGEHSRSVHTNFGCRELSRQRQEGTERI